jgi:hypothetical protein
LSSQPDKLGVTTRLAALNAGQTWSEVLKSVAERRWPNHGPTGRVAYALASILVQAK